RAALGGELLERLGPAVVLREVVDLDDRAAQGLLALPAREILLADDARLEGGLAEVLARARLDDALAHRLAQPLVDRLAGDAGLERLLEHAGRVLLVLRDEDEGREAIARRARLERDARALAVPRVERRAERHAEREKDEAKERRERLHREVGEHLVDRLLRVVER